MTLFQSQTRSRPSCHCRSPGEAIGASSSFNLKREAAPVATLRMISSCSSRHLVSISNEKPPQLPPLWMVRSRHPGALFQSQTRSRPSCHGKKTRKIKAAAPSFNLKREAAPVATGGYPATTHAYQVGFQSQTRSRPSCHACPRRYTGG